ncbi:MAG: ATP-binding protein [Verrucomicrobiota bacterium]
MDEEFLRKAISILRKIQSRAPFRHICNEILKGAVADSKSGYGSFVRIDAEEQRLRIVATAGKSWTEERSDLKLEIGIGITGQVASTGKTYRCDNVAEDPHYVRVLDEVVSELAIPVKVDGEVWGIINLDSDREAHYDASCVLRMQLLAEMVASAIEFRLQMDRERDLSKSLVEAEKLSAMGHLVAGIAHEVNNPLASILGCAELLQDSTQPGEVKTAVEVISTQAQRAGNLVKQLLAFSRMGGEEDRDITDIADLLKEVEDLVAPSLRVSRVRLEVVLPDSSVSAFLNRVQIQQILVNLINNAAHAINDAEIEKGSIRIETQTTEETVAITVQDNGPGLVPGTEHQLFDRFFTTKEKGQGTGLGLSISRDIAHAHEGELTCHSVPGKGCQFTLQLPVTHSPSPTEEKPAHRPLVQNGHTKPKVLIVDDEAPIRWMLKKLLSPKAELLRDASDAEEGFVFCRDHSFDIIISDFHLPGMDGIDLYHQIDRQHLKRFILITGDSSSPRIANFAERNGVTVLEKPFSLEDIVEAVEEEGSNESKTRDVALSS